MERRQFLENSIVGASLLLAGCSNVDNQSNAGGDQRTPESPTPNNKGTTVEPKSCASDECTIYSKSYTKNGYSGEITVVKLPNNEATGFGYNFNNPVEVKLTLKVLDGENIDFVWLDKGGKDSETSHIQDELSKVDTSSWNANQLLKAGDYNAIIDNSTRFSTDPSGEITMLLDTMIKLT